MPTIGPASAGSAFMYPTHMPDKEVTVIGLHADDPVPIVRKVLRRGFTPVWASEIAAAVAGRGTLPARPVCFIFDDGAPSWYTVTHPALMAYNVKATLAVTSNYLYGTTWNPVLGTDPGITWNQARTMHATGLYDWQNHGQTHNAQPSSAELTACNQAIMTELGVPRPVAVIYPNGVYSADMVARAKGLGFTLGFKYGSGVPDRPTQFPTPGMLTINRTALLTDPLKWAKQTTLYDHELDMLGGINAGNALDFWTFSTGTPLYFMNGEGIQAVGASKKVTTSDFFYVESRGILSFVRVGSTGQTAGTGRVSIRQFDAARVELARIDLATVSADQDLPVVESDVDLAANCRFVQLEIATDAAYNGTFTAFRWQVRTRG